MNGGEVDAVLVEDSPYDVELVMRVLRREGFDSRCVVLKNGAEALEFLFAEGEYAGRSVSNTPKVILLDLKLPRVDGIEVLRRLKSDERTRTVPVVILTASAEARDLKDAYDLGANSYITKPIEFAEFAEVISELGLYWLKMNRVPVR